MKHTIIFLLLTVLLLSLIGCRSYFMEPEAIREDDKKGHAPRALYKRFDFTEGKLTVEFDYPVQEFVLRGNL